MNIEDITFEERQQLGLEILDEIDRVCKLLNLKYYLAYGTLLGAIRHKGFIPWDDDIDIWMPREDFVKFNKEFNNITSNDFKLLTYHDNENYPFLSPKIVSMKTKVAEKLMKPIKDLGIWVDLFPLDNLTPEDNNTTRELIKLEHRRWMALYESSTITAKIKLFFYNLIQHDTKWSDRKMQPGLISCKKEAITTNCIKTGFLRCPGNEEDIKMIFKAENFDYPLTMPFQDRMYPVPVGYDSILKQLYGDYMTPPPVNVQKRNQHLKLAKWR